MTAPLLFLVLIGFGAAPAGDGGSLRLELPADTKVASAVAVARDEKAEVPGRIEKETVTFDKLAPATAYDARLTLADGSVIQGVNMNWYNEEESRTDVKPLSDDDRKEMLGIISIPDFYDKHEILQLAGDHDRAVALVQLVRDKDFIAGAGQVIWRVELYYFKNQHGGWEKVPQQNRIVRRERFKSSDEYTSITGRTRFLAALGGLMLGKDHATTIKVGSLVEK